jgi:hypothetical protein
MQIDEEGIKNLLVNMVMKKQLLKDIDPQKKTHTFLHVLIYLRMNYKKFNF